MNKYIKGAVSGAAGIALLLGGVGSFALWNSSTDVNAGTITSGTLSLTAGTDGAWNNTTQGHTGSIDPAAFRMVPGNTVKFTETLTVKGTGDNLTAKLTADTSHVVNGIAGATTAVSFTNPTGTLTIDPTTNVVTMPKAGTSSVTVTVTVDFPKEATGGQNAAIDLTGLSFTLQQQTPVIATP